MHPRSCSRWCRNLAAWGLNQVNGALGGGRTSRASPELTAALASQGVLLHGLEVLGGGAALSRHRARRGHGLHHRAAALAAAAFAAAGAVFTFFGLMHGERVGIGQSPAVAAGYLAVAAIFAGCAKFATVTAARGGS